MSKVALVKCDSYDEKVTKNLVACNYAGIACKRLLAKCN